MEQKITKGMKELTIKDCEEFEKQFLLLDTKMKAIHKHIKEILEVLNNESTN